MLKNILNEMRFPQSNEKKSAHTHNISIEWAICEHDERIKNKNCCWLTNNNSSQREKNAVIFHVEITSG